MKTKPEKQTLKMDEVLYAYGVLTMLGHAIAKNGRFQLTNDWDGSYRNPVIESTDCLLRKAVWEVERYLQRKPK